MAKIAQKIMEVPGGSSQDGRRWLITIPDLPVPYIFGTKLSVTNISGNDRPLVPNIPGTGR